MLPFLHNFFSEIQTLTVNEQLDRRNRIASDIETSEAFPARKTNLVDFDKLEGYNPKRPKVVAPEWQGQFNAQPSKWGLGTVQFKSIRGRVLWWPF